MAGNLKGKIVTITTSDGRTMPFAAESLSGSGFLARKAMENTVLDGTSRNAVHLKVLLQSLLFGVDSAIMPVAAEIPAFARLLGEMELTSELKKAFADRIVGSCSNNLSIPIVTAVDQNLGRPSSGWQFMRGMSRKRPRDSHENEQLLSMSRETLLDIMSHIPI